MRAYQKILPQIARLGGSLLAISPQSPDKSQATLLKNFLQYEVLSDLLNVVGRQFGLVYEVPEYVRDVYRSVGEDVPVFNADHSWELPLPGTFVIGTDRIILLAYADTAPQNRLEPQTILDTLQALSATKPGLAGEPL